MVRYVFIINPRAGKYDHTKEITEKLKRLMHKYPIEILVTEHKGHAEELVEEKARQYSDEIYVYACGGDGTLNEVINGAWRYPHVSVGIIPIGSGNDFIRTFENVPKESFLNLENMINGSTVPIDLLFAGRRAGVNVITAGFDCAVAKNMVRFKKFPLVSGSMAYKISLIYCLASKTKNRFSLFADNKEIKDENNCYLFALAMNGRFYGGGFKAAPTANMADGKIEFIRVPTISRLKFLRVVGKYKSGEYINDPSMGFIKTRQCKELKILADAPIDVCIDGEIIQEKNPVIHIKHHAVKMIFPLRAIHAKCKEKKVKVSEKQLAPAMSIQKKNR